MVAPAEVGCVARERARTSSWSAPGRRGSPSRCRPTTTGPASASSSGGPEPFRPSRALIVHPRTLEVLRPLGVVDALLAGATSPARSTAPRAARGAGPARRLRPARHRVPALLLGARRTSRRSSRTRSPIVGSPSSAAIELRRLAATRTATQSVAAPDGHRRARRCRYVAGCDGARSTVRRLAGVGWHGGSYAPEVVLADVELDGDLAPGRGARRRRRRGRAVRVRAGRARDLAAARHPAARTTQRRPGMTCRPASCSRCSTAPGSPARRHGRVVEPRPARSTGWPSRYRVGPLFLAGDAAHVHSPAGGQGMNTGIQDALQPRLEAGLRRLQRSGSTRTLCSTPTRMSAGRSPARCWR